MYYLKSKLMPLALSVIALLLSACGTKPSGPLLSPVQLPAPSVNMPREPKTILTDLRQILSDSDLRRCERLRLLTPSSQPCKRADLKSTPTDPL